MNYEQQAAFELLGIGAGGLEVTLGRVDIGFPILAASAASFLYTSTMYVKDKLHNLKKNYWKIKKDVLEKFDYYKFE